MQAKAATHERIADIELLRVVAIAFVLVQHAGFNLVFDAPWLQRVLRWCQFWPGVDLFFVISGFLVTSGLLAQRDAVRPGPGVASGWHIVRRFWTRRAFRLWPVAWLWLALILLGSAIWRDPPFLGPFDVDVRHTLAGIAFYANYALATNGWQPYGASFPYWSLSLEEQFYILLPLCLVLGGRLVLPVALAAIALQLPLAHGTLYFFFRSDALLWGVALAFLRRAPAFARWEPVFLVRRPVAACVLFACLAVMVRMAGTGNTTPPFAAGIIAAAGAVLVWIASYDRDYFCPPALRAPVLWLGARTYALYVTHMPVYLCAAALAHHLFAPDVNIFKGASDAYALPLGLVSLFVVADITHRFVEQPLRRHGAALTRAR